MGPGSPHAGLCCGLSALPLLPGPGHGLRCAHALPTARGHRRDVRPGAWGEPLIGPCSALLAAVSAAPAEFLPRLGGDRHDQREPCRFRADLPLDHLRALSTDRWAWMDRGFRA